jgi:Rv0078B-related antitoxin
MVREGRIEAGPCEDRSLDSCQQPAQTGVDLMRQNLRRRHPEALDDEIERLLGEWLQERPGAEFGDCPGPTVDMNTLLA